MAIVNKKSSIYGTQGAAGYSAPNSSSRNGRINRVAGTVSCDVTDSSGSTYVVCEVPSSAILLPESRVKTTAWGFAQAVLGVAGTTDGLLDVTKATGGVGGNAPVVVFDAKWNQPIWQQLGLAKDPNMPLTLIISAEADATVAGQIDFDLQFANHV